MKVLDDYKIMTSKKRGKNKFESIDIRKDTKEWYSVDNILKCGANYNFVYGERSNGKTTGVLLYGLKKYFMTGGQIGLIRRNEVDFSQGKSKTMFNTVLNLIDIKKWTDGVWEDITYKSMAWYLSRRDKNTNKTILSDKPIAYGFAVSQWNHYKSNSYPDIETILFDEAITKDGYLEDEFVHFANLISTLIRQRDNVEIFLVGNTVNKYCPYFKEMGLTNIKKQEEGTIDVYNYGDSGLKVAVEYTDHGPAKPSDVFFAFDNPKLKMITSGSWELGVFPHCPIKYEYKDIRYIYFIIFDDEIYQCNIVVKDGVSFTYIHRKTTPIKYNPKEIVFTDRYSPLPNHRFNIMNFRDDIGKLIYSYYFDRRVYYQDNEVGNAIENYLMWCKSNR